jgi:Zn-dependent M28 family amino/carboxypeptidase
MLDQVCNDTRKCSCFIYDKKKIKNDIIILFSDAEELGLNAALFVTQHKWAKDIGLVLNFEARGSSDQVIC